MPGLLNNIFRDFGALLFPGYCYACEKALVKGESLICTYCRMRLPYTNIPHQEPDAALKHRFSGQVNLQHALAFLYFKRAGRVQRLLHALKYQGQQEIGLLLGQWYGEALRPHGFGQAFDQILPVPLHAARRRQRGYNQSESFAQGLSQALEVPVATQALARQVATSSQTHKSRAERWRNVEQVFRVTQPELVRDRRVLLVDDVLTTGATLEACALTLVRAGCREVSVGAIAAA
ncbi:MAG: ComF family protein [Adhaeribacter sp.]